jgi:hypothetical protein
VRAKALAILGTTAADLFFNRWDLGVPSGLSRRYISRCVRYYSQSV